MEIVATFADMTKMNVFVDKWAVDAAMETFMEMGAIYVSAKEEV
jgi:hypothetical protein